MKKLIPIVILSTALLAVAVWWFGSDSDSQNPSSESSYIAPAPTEQEPETLPATEDGIAPTESQPVSTAKTIAHVPPRNLQTESANTPFDDIDAVTTETLDKFTRHNLDAAIAGDLDAGYRVSQARRKCDYAPRTMKQVEVMVQRMQQKFEHAFDRGITNTYMFDSPENEFPTVAENRAHQMRWFNACGLQRGLLNDELRNGLDKLAQQGHVVARYLYAIWPPDYLGESDGFLIQHEWETKAREYSFLNLEQGEVAGLIAFGEAYSQGGLFANYDMKISYALYKAAIDCGFTDARIVREVEYFFGTYENNPQETGSRQPEVLAMAEELMLYCR